MLRTMEVSEVRFTEPLGFLSTASVYGGLAQLARAPALQAGGQRFESVILHYSGGRDAAEQK